MQFSVSVSDSFEASHEIGIPPCDQFHGHTWHVTVTVMQETLGRAGQVPGSDGLREALRELVDLYRFRSLNDKMPAVETTPGGVAVNIMERLSLRFPRIASVTVKMGEIEEVMVWRELRS